MHGCREMGFCGGKCCTQGVTTSSLLGVHVHFYRDPREYICVNPRSDDLSLGGWHLRKGIHKDVKR